MGERAVDRRKSDKHSVTLDVGENLAKLLGGQIGVVSPSQKLDAIITMLTELGGVPAQQGFHTEELNLIHELINNLNGKVDEFMATQEERLQGVNTALTSIADGINTLQQQVADLKANNPALDDEISAIEGTVKTIADDINGVVPDTGTGETGGGTTEGGTRA
jgi:uncharacterized phage infection (PIP) family protein YhgE